MAGHFDDIQLDDMQPPGASNDPAQQELSPLQRGSTKWASNPLYQKQGKCMRMCQKLASSCRSGHFIGIIFVFGVLGSAILCSWLGIQMGLLHDGKHCYCSLSL